MGKIAKILCVEKATVFLQLANGKVINTYPVTNETENGRRTCYPFMPASALTITKLAIIKTASREQHPKQLV